MKAVKVMLPVKTVKRLFAAEGYLELGMPEQALEELALIEDPAPIEASVEYRPRENRSNSTSPCSSRLSRSASALSPGPAFIWGRRLAADRVGVAISLMLRIFLDQDEHSGL